MELCSKISGVLYIVPLYRLPINVQFVDPAYVIASVYNILLVMIISLLSLPVNISPPPAFKRLLAFHVQDGETGAEYVFLLFE